MFPAEDDPLPQSGSDPRIPLYRVVDAAELAYLQMTGNYGSNASRSGKYFALTLGGATAFAAAPINAGAVITETSLPQAVLNQGWRMIDPGPQGAGPSVYFSEGQLAMVYAAMTLPAVVSGGGFHP